MSSCSTKQTARFKLLTQDKLLAWPVFAFHWSRFEKVRQRARFLERFGWGKAAGRWRCVALCSEQVSGLMWTCYLVRFFERISWRRWFEFPRVFALRCPFLTRAIVVHCLVIQGLDRKAPWRRMPLYILPHETLQKSGIKEATVVDLHRPCRSSSSSIGTSVRVRV